MLHLKAWPKVSELLKLLVKRKMSGGRMSKVSIPKISTSITKKTAKLPSLKMPRR